MLKEPNFIQCKMPIGGVLLQGILALFITVLHTEKQVLLALYLK